MTSTFNHQDSPGSSKFLMGSLRIGNKSIEKKKADPRIRF